MVESSKVRFGVVRTDSILLFYSRYIIIIILKQIIFSDIQHDHSVKHYEISYYTLKSKIYTTITKRKKTTNKKQEQKQTKTKADCRRITKQNKKYVNGRGIFRGTVSSRTCKRESRFSFLEAYLVRKADR